MRVLALETSGMAGSVAVLEDDDLLAEIELDPTRRTAQTLAPAVHDILQQVSWKPANVNLVVVTRGPGSFTGLRIGIATAKAFAYATGAEVIGINTLAAMAEAVNGESLPATDTQLSVVMNAEREQLFAAGFRCLESIWTEVEATHIVDSQAWIDRIAAGSNVTGPGLKGLIARIPAGVHIVAQSLWTPAAANVGRLGLRAFRAGVRSDCWSLLPDYFRESAAVEKARESKP